MVDSNSKGARREREFRNYCREHDHLVALRMPASGSGTDMDLPDMLVGGDTNLLDTPWAVELKTADPESGYVYLPSEEVEALRRFAEAFDANPLIGARWDGDTAWYLDSPGAFHRTDSGSVRLDPRGRDAAYLTIARPDGY